MTEALIKTMLKYEAETETLLKAAWSRDPVPTGIPHLSKYDIKVLFYDTESFIRILTKYTVMKTMSKNFDFSDVKGKVSFMIESAMPFLKGENLQAFVIYSDSVPYLRPGPLSKTSLRVSKPTALLMLSVLTSLGLLTTNTQGYVKSRIFKAYVKRMTQDTDLDNLLRFT